MQVAYSTHIGNVRTINEDRLYVTEPYLFIIADGMGGHNAGEVASSCAVEYVGDKLGAELKNKSIPMADVLDKMVDVILEANDYIYNKAAGNENLAGMGTTMVCMVVIDDVKAYIANIGDSRLYLVRNNDIRQVTRDHSFVAELLRTGNITKEEAINHPQKNVITRAVGYSDTLEVDTHIEEMYSGDIIIMCTDGVTNMLDDDTLKSLVTKDKNINEICEDVIKEVNLKGGVDNSTIIIIRV